MDPLEIWRLLGSLIIVLETPAVFLHFCQGKGFTEWDYSHQIVFDFKCVYFFKGQTPRLLQGTEAVQLVHMLANLQLLALAMRTKLRAWRTLQSARMESTKNDEKKLQNFRSI